MPTVTVSVDIDADDVLEEIDTEDLIRELERRQAGGHHNITDLKLAAEQFRWHLVNGDQLAALDVARVALEDATGRLLN